MSRLTKHLNRDKRLSLREAKQAPLKFQRVLGWVHRQIETNLDEVKTEWLALSDVIPSEYADDLVWANALYQSLQNIGPERVVRELKNRHFNLNNLEFNDPTRLLRALVWIANPPD